MNKHVRAFILALNGLFLSFSYYMTQYYLLLFAFAGMLNLVFSIIFGLLSSVTQEEDNEGVFHRCAETCAFMMIVIIFLLVMLYQDNVMHFK